MDKLFRYLEMDGILDRADVAINSLVYLYIAGEIVEAAVDNKGYSFCDAEIKSVDIEMLPTLKSYGLARSSSRTSDKWAPRFTSLTLDGRKIAKKAVKERISEHVDEMEAFAAKNPKLVQILLRGLRKSKRGRGIAIEGTNPTGLGLEDRFELYDVLPHMQSAELDVLPKICCKNLLAPPSDIEWAFCHFYTHTIFRKAAFQLFEFLESIGLAARVYVHDAWGNYLWDEYRAPEEVVKAMFCPLELERQHLERFAALAAILYTGFSLELEELAMFYGIPAEVIEEEREVMERLGMVDGRKILRPERLEKHAKIRFAEIVCGVLG
ncbi:hypothetical protein [Archaeoglobus veneficus]|uniref:Uncharacterized protein n=1 Tax=Archaeoglobus veneficus (strain DSM 11195 / SNP6) TaxID=693661 RepID=F2KSY8_ARCVS|nr:hypothetical protein [Archaeoglobus veneficus]AEA48132.1 hypothetical protein Arcve_2143 [Archaeoglobus veneficus SNP6]